MIRNYSYDTSWMGDTDKKLKSDAPFTVGITTNQALLADERSRVDAREKFGMPRVGASKMASGVPTGTAGMSQGALADRLKAIAAGGPSAGQQQTYAANEQAKRALMASAFGKPGGGAPAMRAARTTGNQAALMDATTARQASIIGAQEQQAAQAQYAQIAAAMRQGDLAEADEANRIGMANAGFAQSAALANQDAALRWQQMNDQQKRMLLGMGIDLSQNEWDNKLGYYGALRGREMDWLNARRQQDALDNQRTAQAAMSVVSMGTAGMKGGA